MLKYPCLVLDHDDTVVQTEKAMAYPFFKAFIERIRPGRTVTYQEYVRGCSTMVFADMCRTLWQFTEDELKEEYVTWKAFTRENIPPLCPGIERIVQRQKEEGGLVCVASLSTEEVILRDYSRHFGFIPDAVYDYDLPVDKRKPNPYPLQDIMERFHLRPEEILMVDDMKLGWDMASRVGVPTAFAGWSKEELPEMARQMRSVFDYSFNSTDALYRFLFRED